MIYLTLFLSFAKIGALTFGGGYAMISLIQQEMIVQGWLSAEEFLNLVAVAQMTPGALALNTATYVGKVVAGIPGALAASFGLVSPALILTSLAAMGFSRLQRSARFQGVVKGLRAAAVGLIFTAVLFFAKNSLITPTAEEGSKNDWLSGLPIRPVWPGIIIFAVTLFLNQKLKLSPAYCILIALGLGAGSFFIPIFNPSP